MKSTLRTYTRRRTVYDRAAIVEMAKTMSRRDIIEKTGISKSYLSQVFAAAGVKNSRGRRQGARAEESSAGE
jgi:hypothetical protein